MPCIRRAGGASSPPPTAITTSPSFPDRSRDREIEGPNQLWVADLTYIAILGGFVYLAAIMDAWSHRITGYALGRRIDARLTLAALATAIERRNPPAGCIHHSDRGSQYVAQAYRDLAHATMGWSARWRGAATPTTTP